MDSVGFWYPVDYFNQPKTSTQSFPETIDHYFYLGGKTARVIPGEMIEALYDSFLALTTEANLRAGNLKRCLDLRRIVSNNYNLNSREAIYAKVVEAYREKGKLIAALTTINKIISNTKIKLDFLNAVIEEQFILVSQAKGYYSHEEKEKLLNVINRIPQ